jgi:tetratricopeptide (TPR) repeat protein
MFWRWLILASLLCGGARAGAQSAPKPQAAAPAPDGQDRTEEAKGLFNAGRAAFDSGRYADSLDYFQRAYAISGRAGLLYNIGLAYDRLREDERALDAYDQYLTHAPDAQNRVEVETRAAAIRAALARRQPAEAAAPTPAETAAAATAPAPVATAATSEPTPRADRETSSGLLSQWWFWVAAGVVVAGGVTAGVLVASSGDDEPDPIAPSSGIVVSTLLRSP